MSRTKWTADDIAMAAFGVLWFLLTLCAPMLF